MSDAVSEWKCTHLSKLKCDLDFNISSHLIDNKVSVKQVVIVCYFIPTWMAKLFAKEVCSKKFASPISRPFCLQMLNVN